MKNIKHFYIDSHKDLAVAKEKTPEDMVLTVETNNKLSKALNTFKHKRKNIISGT